MTDAPDMPDTAHTFVETGADGRPDLDDIVRLIRWARSPASGIGVSVASATGAAVSVEWIDPDDRVRRIVEGSRLPADGDALFLGPDGALYDANGELL
jgi:hypothetical protein